LWPSRVEVSTTLSHRAKMSLQSGATGSAIADARLPSGRNTALPPSHAEARRHGRLLHRSVATCVSLVLAGGTGALLWSVSGPKVGLRAVAVTQGLCLVYIAIAERSYVRASAPVLLAAVPFAQAAIIGLIRVLTGATDPVVYGEYLLLGVGGIVGLIAGQACGRKAHGNRSFYWSVVLAVGASETFLLIPRILDTGLAVRSSLGTVSVLAALLLGAVSAESTKMRAASALLGAIGLAAALLSGMRSSTAVALATLVVVAPSLIRRPKSRASAVVFVLAITLAGIVVTRAQTVKDNLDLVSLRLQRTLLNESARSLDDGRSRVEEATAALETFDNQAGALGWALGLGFGFTYPMPHDPATLTAHVHITPVAFFVRYGVVGLVSLTLGLMIVGWESAKLSRGPNAFAGGPMVVASMYVAALIAGSLVLPQPWFVLGLYSARRPLASNPHHLLSPNHDA
jgi:hypothetical protein